MNAEEKQKLKNVLSVLDKIGVSDKAYHEQSMHFSDMPRKYLIGQIRNKTDKFGYIERTPENMLGAYVSFYKE